MEKKEEIKDVLYIFKWNITKAEDFLIFKQIIKSSYNTHSHGLNSRMKAKQRSTYSTPFFRHQRLPPSLQSFQHLLFPYLPVEVAS